jgi:integrase
VSAARPKKRNANREGRVWQRGDGRWTARVYGPEKGSRAHYVYGRTREDCKTAKKNLEDELAKGMPAEDQTLGEFLEAWIDGALAADVATGHLSQSTRDSYADNARKHIIPDLGHIRLRQLKPSRIKQWQADLLLKPSGRPAARRKDDAARPAPATLSPRTAAYCHAILRRAVNDAWRDKLVADNPVARVKPAKPDERVERVLTLAEKASLLEAFRADRFRCYWFTLLALGIRRSEGLAIRWSDVDLDGRTIRLRETIQRVRGDADPETGRRTGKLIAKDMKTASSARTVAIGDELAEELRAHQREQRIMQLRSLAWKDRDLVFTTSIGSAIEPRNINRQWAKVCERAGVRDARIHDLRHAFGTYLAAAGMHPKVIQSALGHARMSTTEIYVHAAEEVSRDVAAAIDGHVTDLRKVAGRQSRKTS